MKQTNYLTAIVSAAVLFGGPVSDAATRARTRAETVLNDAPVRIATGWFHSCQVNEDGTVR